MEGKNPCCAQKKRGDRQMDNSLTKVLSKVEKQRFQSYPLGLLLTVLIWRRWKIPNLRKKGFPRIILPSRWMISTPGPRTPSWGATSWTTTCIAALMSYGREGIRARKTGWCFRHLLYMEMSRINLSYWNILYHMLLIFFW